MASLQKVIIIIVLIVIVILGGVIGFRFLLTLYDKDPPILISVGYDPHPEVNTSTTIQIFVDDISGIETCRIIYRINESDWITKEMRHYAIICCPPRYLIRLGPLTDIGTIYEFYFEVIDKKNNKLTSETFSFTIIDS